MVRIPTDGPPTHPGEMLLEEFLKPLGLSQTGLAKRLGVSTAFAGRETHPQDPAHHAPGEGDALVSLGQAQAGLFGSARISANAGVARSGLQNRGLQVRFLPGLFPT